MDKLSDYEKYILMVEGVPRVSSTMSAFYQFKELVTFIESCSKSDSDYIDYKGNSMKKPIDRNKALSLLSDIDRMRWNHDFKSLAFKLELELN